MPYILSTIKVNLLMLEDMLLTTALKNLKLVIKIKRSLIQQCQGYHILKNHWSQDGMKKYILILNREK